MNLLKQRISQGSIYSKLMILVGVLILVPIVVIPFYLCDLEHMLSFAIPSAISIVLGILGCFLGNRERESHAWQSTMQKGSLPVLFAWCYGILAGAVPFVISGQLSFLHALFESVSGWSTTGLTIVDVTLMPKIFLFHRSFMQYCGGLGFILMILMLVRGQEASNLFNAEGHPDRLMPSIRRTGRKIFLIYNSFLGAGTIFYALFGMPLFDAVCHTMSALSTAGFTTQPNSIGTYGSIAIEIITIILMLVGATNFAVLLLLTRFKFKRLFRVSEVRFMIVLVVVSTLLIAAILMPVLNMDIGASLRQALFGVVTTFSTTGYSTMYYAEWPPFAVGLIMILMFIGGSTGSTAGGIKLLRTYTLLKVSYANIKKRLSPSRKVMVLNYRRAQGKEPIDSTLVADMLCFVFCYVLVFLVGALLITLFEGCSLFDAMFEFASALGTIGISNGVTSVSSNNGTLIIEMIGMLLGRLEIFIVFIGVQVGISKILKKLFPARKNAA